MRRRIIPSLNAKCRWCMLTIVMLLFIFTATAHAGPFRMTGYDTAAIGVANSQIAYGSGHGVLFSNPALMSRFEPGSSVEFIFMIPRLKISVMDRPANSDIPLVYYETQIDKATTTPDRALPTIELRNKREDTNVGGWNPYISAGFTHSLGIEGFRVGSLVMLPLPDQVTTRTHFPHEQEQYFSNKLHFERFGEYNPTLTGFFGASYMPIKYISFGVSVQISVAATATMDLYMPSIQADDYAKSNASVSGNIAFRPVVGIQAEPTEWMSIGLTWKLWQYMDVDGAGRMLLWNYRQPPLEQDREVWAPKRINQEDHNYALDYEPMELALALGFNYADWEIQVGAQWNHWSKYLDNHHESPEDSVVYDDNDPAINGDDYKWGETFSVVMGTSYRYFDWAQVKAGFGYYPSPVPEQDSRTSYVDSDTFVFALGHRFDFPILEQQFHAELGFQFWHYIERTVYKDPAKIRDEWPDEAPHIFEQTPLPAAAGLQTNNPGFPGYKSSGWMIVGAASVTYEF